MEKRKDQILFYPLVTLFQVPHYEHLQILICNGNSLTTLAGVEHIKHLWKLDVGNNQVKIPKTKTNFMRIENVLDSKSSAFISFHCSRFIDLVQ